MEKFYLFKDELTAKLRFKKKDKKIVKQWRYRSHRSESSFRAEKFSAAFR